MEEVSTTDYYFWIPVLPLEQNTAHSAPQRGVAACDLSQKEESMKPILQHWQFGIQLLARLVIMLFCVAAGPALFLAVHFTLVSQGVILPATSVLIIQLIGCFVVAPFLLAGYAKYCGFRPDASQTETTI